MNDKLSIFHKLHILSLIILGFSVSLWAIFSDHYAVPSLWLIMLSAILMIHNKTDFLMFLRRFAKIGATLIIISILQLVFRRSGEVLWSYHGVNLIYERGLMEAVLLWIRFMLLFVMASIFSFTSIFDLTRFLVSIHIPLNVSMLFSTTMKLIPFIYMEAKRILWFLQFRGIRFQKLSLKDKIIALKKLLYPLLIRSIHYISYSGLALELRGYGVTEYRKLPISYQLQRIDYVFIILIISLNVVFLGMDQRY